MKKMWLVLVAVLVLCLVSCAGAEECVHFASCNAPTTCENCGATDIAAEVYHEEYTYFKDDTHHWTECNLCHEVFDSGVHTAYCIETDKCWWCGETNCVIAGLKHTDTDDYDVVSATMHQHVCTDCREPFEEPEQHVASCCDDPTFCMICHSSGIIAELKHGFGVWRVLSETMHQVVCEDCDEPKHEPERHETLCYDETNTCIICDYLPAENPQIAHSSSIPTYDETRHWSPCDACGEAIDGYAPHAAWCYAPDYCCLCLAEGVTISEIVHLFDSNGTCSECGFSNSLPGDADGNSSVTIDDAIAILSGNVSSESNADVNGDGKVDQQDVLRIMQYLAGWGVTLQ